MKATEKIRQLVEEINDEGISGDGGVYSHFQFALEHEEVDVKPQGIVQMSLKDALAVSNQLKNIARVVILETKGNVICKCLTKRGQFLDIYVTCSSIQFPEEMESVVGSCRVQLDKFARDNGFTPGRHCYNVLDAWIPWESVRTVSMERDEEGWI